jgi:hypothetical protein
MRALYPSPAAPAPPALTLLTWDEYKAFQGANSLGLSDSNSNGLCGLGRLGLSGDNVPAQDSYDAYGAYTYDDSDDDDMSLMSDDEDVPAALYRATCRPIFSVASDGSPYSPTGVLSPAQPSTSLEECINTPTFALVPLAAHAAWRDEVASKVSAATRTDLASTPSVPTAQVAIPAPASCSSSPATSPAMRHARPPKTGSVQTNRRKRSGSAKTHANANDELNDAVKSFASKRIATTTAAKRKNNRQRHPLQPKVPNAPVAARSLTA